MRNYLRINVPNTGAEWFKQLFMGSGIFHHFQPKRDEYQYHMTLLFVEDDSCVDQLTPGFSEILTKHKAFPFNLDKLGVLNTRNGYVIYLTSSNEEQIEQIRALVSDVRELADKLNVNYNRNQEFIPHITLGVVPYNAIVQEDLKNILAQIQMPTFQCSLNMVEYFYYERNRRIKQWNLYDNSVASSFTQQKKKEIKGKVKKVARDIYNDFLHHPYVLSIGLGLLPADQVKVVWPAMFHYYKFTTCCDIGDAYDSAICHFPPSLKEEIDSVSKEFSHPWCQSYLEYMVYQEFQRILEARFTEPDVQERFWNYPMDLTRHNIVREL